MVRASKNFLIVMALLSLVATLVLSLRTDRIEPNPSNLLKNDFYRARVTEIIQEGTREGAMATERFQIFKAIILSDGPYKDQTVEVESSGITEQRVHLRVTVGDKLVLERGNESTFFHVSTRYRLNGLYWLIAIFIFVVLFFSGKRGLYSLAGLGVTVVVLIAYTVPNLLSGSNPLVVTMISSTIILSLALPLAHGFNLRTSISLVSSLGALALASLLAVAGVNLLKLFGIGSEEGVYLQFLGGQGIDTRGILLGGIIIGTLGVIDDIVASQVATVAELKRTDAALKARELFARGLRVGREHVASLVNTLVLAYAGASLPLLLLFSYYQAQPLWTTLNSDIVAEEIARTLIGSMTLIVAVPIATGLAAYVLTRSTRRT